MWSIFLSVFIAVRQNFWRQLNLELCANPPSSGLVGPCINLAAVRHSSSLRNAKRVNRGQRPRGHLWVSPFTWDGGVAPYSFFCAFSALEKYHHITQGVVRVAHHGMCRIDTPSLLWQYFALEYSSTQAVHTAVLRPCIQQYSGRNTTVTQAGVRL